MRQSYMAGWRTIKGKLKGRRNATKLTLQLYLVSVSARHIVIVTGTSKQRCIATKYRFEW